MTINSNDINLTIYRGDIIPCKWCQPTTSATLHSHCRFCLDQHFLAKCMKCETTGKVSGAAVWGSKSVHESTCDICGGLGYLPSRGPATPAAPEIKEEKHAHHHPAHIKPATAPIGELIAAKAEETKTPSTSVAAVAEPV